MQLCADVTVKGSVFPDCPTVDKLIGLKFRILNTDHSDCIYEIISASEQWDVRWGFQYNLHCKVIQGIAELPSTPEDPAPH